MGNTSFTSEVSLELYMEEEAAGYLMRERYRVGQNASINHRDDCDWCCPLSIDSILNNEALWG
jgi:hypothetical protein